MKKLMFLAVLIITAFATVCVGSAATKKDIVMRVDGKVVNFPDAKPFINTDNRTLVPIRFLESLGAEVEWLKESKSVFIKCNGVMMDVKVGEKKVSITNIEDKIEDKIMDTKAILKSERVYVPYRFIAETFGAVVTWKQAEKTIYVSTQKFIEPKIIVDEPTIRDEGILEYFTLQLDNYYKYKSDDYEIKFECTNYPQLNTIESPDGDGGWFGGVITGWSGCSQEIFTLTRKYYSTRENEKTLKITDGMEIKYIVTIRQKSTGIKKEYPGTVIVKDKKWD